MKIYVGNLSGQTCEDDLREAFEMFGQVGPVNVVCDRETGESWGFGFVTMPVTAEAERAVSKMNGRDLNGHAIKVQKGLLQTSYLRNHRRGGRRGRR